MSNNTESFGIMNQAYWVSRTDILQWVNETLKLELHKVE